MTKTRDDSNKRTCCCEANDEEKGKQKRAKSGKQSKTNKRCQKGGHDEKWEVMFTKLKIFQKKHGHCLVPNRYEGDPQLGTWVATQRRQLKLLMSNCGYSIPMTIERKSRLEEIGFVWSPKDPYVPWEVRFKELEEFSKKHGHAEVPMRLKENPALSNWVSTQRQEYKSKQKGHHSRMTDERIKKLEDLGFIWEAKRGTRAHSRKNNSSSDCSVSSNESKTIPVCPCTAANLQRQSLQSSRQHSTNTIRPPEEIGVYSNLREGPSNIQQLLELANRSNLPYSPGAMTTEQLLAAVTNNSFTAFAEREFERRRSAALFQAQSGLGTIYNNLQGTSIGGGIGGMNIATNLGLGMELGQFQTGLRSKLAMNNGLYRQDALLSPELMATLGSASLLNPTNMVGQNNHLPVFQNNSETPPLSIEQITSANSTQNKERELKRKSDLNSRTDLNSDSESIIPATQEVASTDLSKIQDYESEIARTILNNKREVAQLDETPSNLSLPNQDSTAGVFQIADYLRSNVSGLGSLLETTPLATPSSMPKTNPFKRRKHF